MLPGVTGPTTATAPPAMSDRVASNTLIGLAEVAITAVISIFYVRLLFQALGDIDYGIFTALGASGLLSVIVVGGFNNAALRYLALAAGGDDDGQRRTTMASTVVLYVGITLALFVTAVALRDFVLGTLRIPADRADAAATVYWSVVGQFCFAAATAPFNAVRHAHQRFGLVSLVDIGQRVLVLVFLIALSLRPTLSDDALESVAMVVLAGAGLRFLIISSHSLATLPGSRFRLRNADTQHVRSIMRFARWSILNSLSAEGRNQFAILLINVGFGPIVNGAYALGLSTNMMIQRFARAFNKSLHPAMTSLYGVDQDRDLAGLISVGCRYAAMVSVAPLAAVLVEMDNFLALWIGDAPPNAALYARLIALGTFARLVSSGFGAAINATDKMRPATLLGVGPDFATIGAGVVSIFAFDGPAWSLPAIIIVGSLVRNLIFVGYFGPQYGFRMGRWVREVIWPVGLSFSIVVGCGWIASRLLDPSIARLLLVGAVTVLSTAATIRWIVSSAAERELLMKWIRRATTRS